MKGERKTLFTQEAVLKELAFSKTWGFLATGFGSGLYRAAPGTAGTVVALPFGWILAHMPIELSLAVVLSLFIAGVYLCRLAEEFIGASDPGAIVWDEIVGFCLVAILSPEGFHWFAAGFLAFRVLDILKPWPIRFIERHTHGGFGIMVDDVVAALYAVVLLQFTQWAASAWLAA